MSKDGEITGSTISGFSFVGFGGVEMFASRLRNLVIKLRFNSRIIYQLSLIRCN